MNYSELKDCALFSGITEDELIKLDGCIPNNKRTFTRDEIIYLENSNISSIGVILSGSVVIVKEDFWGNSSTIVILGRYELIGETFALGDCGNSTVTYKAASDTEILFMNMSSIIHSCGNSCSCHHQLSDNLVRMIANKNRLLMEKIEITSKKTLREKILCYLSIEAQRARSSYFEIPLGRVGLADYLCADRSALTRELNRMRDEKLIDFDRNMFRVMKPRAV